MNLPRRVTSEGGLGEVGNSRGHGEGLRVGSPEELTFLLVFLLTERPLGVITIPHIPHTWSLLCTLIPNMKYTQCVDLPQSWTHIGFHILHFSHHKQKEGGNDTHMKTTLRRSPT